MKKGYLPDEIWKIIKDFRGVKCRGADIPGGLAGCGCEKVADKEEQYCILCYPGIPLYTKLDEMLEDMYYEERWYLGE